MTGATGGADDAPPEGSESIICVACPFCDKLILSGYQHEIDHMEAEHMDVIERRLIEAGFRKEDSGRWIDLLVSDDA